MVGNRIIFGYYFARQQLALRRPGYGFLEVPALAPASIVARWPNPFDRVGGQPIALKLGRHPTGALGRSVCQMCEALTLPVRVDNHHNGGCRIESLKNRLRLG